MENISTVATAIGLVAVALSLVALAKAVITLRRVVPTNMVHIVQRRKQTTAHGRGKEAGNIYYAWPSWIPVLGVTVTEFPESIFQVNLDGYEAYDKARLPFVVDVVAFFRVDDAATAAQRVATFVELRSQLNAVLQGSVRRILATNTLEEIMQSRSELGQQFTEEVKDQIAEWGVAPVKTIEFMDLRDSSRGQVIANIMAKEQSRIDMESRVKVAENSQIAAMKEIDAKRTVDVQKVDAEQQVAIRAAEMDKTVGIAREKAHQDVQEQARATAEKTLAVQKVEQERAAEIAKQVAVTKAEATKRQTELDAEARLAQTRRDAEGVQAVAEANLVKTTKEAEGLRAVGEARAAAETAILMAPVTAQLALAEKIGGDEGYQTYLIRVAQVDASKEIGLKMADALSHADLKIISNGSGDQLMGGVTKLTDLFTVGGGTGLSGMLSALAQTEEGSALVNSVVDRISGSDDKS